jgi:hypothetical protein
MSPTRTFYVDDATEASLAARSAGPRDRSAVLRRIVARYEEMVRHSMPKLKKGERRRLANGMPVDPWGGSQFTYVERMAILDAVERYRAAVARGEKPGMPG